jgi:protein gp37
MTKIEWTHQTWNPWWGCNHIATECERCYAASFASRGLHDAHAGIANAGNWTGEITRSSDKVWRQPLKWKTAQRVFTCSMSDFWHEKVPLEWLDEALSVIDQTPHLTYQILTKRPGNIARKLEDLNRSLPANVWLGATIGHTQSIPLLKSLLRVPATVHFLSCEPLLTSLSDIDLSGIGWVIAGGESGRNTRNTDPIWVQELRDKCITGSIPFFFKQWGDWKNNPNPFEEELDYVAKGGATLDGRLWREFPP